MTQTPSTIKKPANWDKAVAAAYLRQIGLSQIDSARGAGVGRRTIQRWEESEFWADACQEASDRWLSHVTSKCRRSIFRGVDDDPHLALKIYERLDARLAPPKRVNEHTGLDGGPIDIQAVHVYVPDNGRQKPQRNGSRNGAKGNGKAKAARR